eukprot:CAMPEP_0197684478 /NCGR_PEP_ID=MMETSP1338-20131121/99550_1 /TAXON_ID=43686 ORGANISM="Pelagodinium beii, Strain RCC1491" /NCGR_SAMPLE_ID=MMETSP1338 /ASSEMBLY_ACC=CAM_ASM_000754 /LENGTH=52 /DNA_ID=CAMNT_0043266195 /DNA_START=211 /DNA_END=369 /DNA_ORIENTATION=+
MGKLISSSPWPPLIKMNRPNCSAATRIRPGGNSWNGDCPGPRSHEKDCKSNA